MKQSSTAAFVNQLLVYTLVLICTSGSAGLGVVWLRHQISTTAGLIQRQEQRIRDVERRLAESSAAIEAEQSPELLVQRNEQWGLGLAPVKEDHVVRVAQDPERRLASKRNRGLFGDGAVLVKFEFSKDQ